MCTDPNLLDAVCLGCNAAAEYLRPRMPVPVLGRRQWCPVCLLKLRGLIGHHIRQALLIYLREHHPRGLPYRVPARPVYDLVAELAGVEVHPVDVGKMTGPERSQTHYFHGLEPCYQRGWRLAPVMEWLQLDVTEAPDSAVPQWPQELPWAALDYDPTDKVGHLEPDPDPPEQDP